MWSAGRQAAAAVAALYHVIAIDTDMSLAPDSVLVALSQLSRRANLGVVHSLPLRAFELEHQYESAFRLLQSGRNLGKVVVRPTTSSDRRDEGTSTHVLTGGTGGFALLTARWLGQRGASCVVLASRSGTPAASAAAEWAQLLQLPTEVRVARCDAAEPSGAR